MRVRGGSYGEDLKQVELGDVTLLPSSINGHRNQDVFEVLGKEHDEEDGPETETDGYTYFGGPGILMAWARSPQGVDQEAEPSCASDITGKSPAIPQEWRSPSGGCCWLKRNDCPGDCDF